MFKFPPQLTIVQVEACRTALLEEVSSCDIIEFDDSAVERIDTLGSQLILAVVIYIAAQNKQLIWQSTSKVIKQSFEQLGLEEAILQQYITV
jgi:anti-anti-sigma regulatory factor